MPVPPSPIAITIGFWSLRWYSLLVTGALMIGLAVGIREIKRRGLSEEFLIDTMLWALPAGIIGARAYYVLFHLDIYSQLPPEKIFAVWEGGIAIHGALFAAFAVAWWYAHRRCIDIVPYLDVVMPCLALAQSIGRWGNWFNQEAYGAETSLPWGMVINGVSYHPAFLYESLWNILLFAILWRALQRGRHQNGFIAAGYLFGYSLGRLWIEELRLDSEWIGPLKAASVWSVLGITIGAYLLYKLWHPKPHITE